MPDWSKPVYSSNVAEVGYREDGNELVISWNKGKTSVYSPVPEELAVQCANAPSVGSFLNSEIKPYFNHRYE